METVKLSFGEKGGLLFSSLNVLQLVGWTAVMIYSGGAAANSLFPMEPGTWCVAIGLLVMLWVFIGIGNIGKIFSGVNFCVRNLAAWALGFGLYRFLLSRGFETPVGLTVPVMLATAVLALLLQSIARAMERTPAK